MKKGDPDSTNPFKTNCLKNPYFQKKNSFRMSPKKPATPNAQTCLQKKNSFRMSQKKPATPNAQTCLTHNGRTYSTRCLEKI